MNSLRFKLHPIRFGRMSGKMAAVIGGIVGADWVWLDGKPCREVRISMDGQLSVNGSPIGPADQFERDLWSVLRLAHLDADERAEFDRLWALKVIDRRLETSRAA